MKSINSNITPEIASDVVSEMQSLNLPISAKSYHVWFGHRVGWYPDMVLEIERALAHNKEIDEDFCEALYTKYIATDGHATALLEAQDSARLLIESVLDNVEGSCGATSDYNGELNHFVERLGKAANVGDVRDIVKELIVQTSNMANTSGDLELNLKQAKNDIGKLKAEMIQLERENLTDPMTGMNNRKALDRHFDICFEKFRTTGERFCVLMLDVDHFKSFNDNYGHDVGDAVLRNVSTTLSDSGHPSAIPHRYGGEEFCLLVGACTIEDAIALGDDIRLRIAGRQLKIARTDEKITPITISVGVASVLENDTPQSILQRADKALYLAKHAGRNNVKCESDLASEPAAANQ
jgi:diguanylate cyclase